MIKNKYKIINIVIFSFLLTTFLYAEKNDRNLPIEINADSTIGTKNNNNNQNMELVGNVIVTQGTLKIKSDKITLEKNDNDKSIINAYGKPAKFEQRLDYNRKYKNNMIYGNANHIYYNEQSNIIEFKGNAKIVKSGDVISGEYIKYNIYTEEFKVTGNKKNRANMILYPKNKK